MGKKSEIKGYNGDTISADKKEKIKSIWIFRPDAFFGYR